VAEPRTVLITGATSGIGLATAVLLAEEGDRVIGVGRAPQKASGRGEELASRGRSLEFFKLDVRDLPAVRQFVSDLVERVGRLDVLVNAAGVLTMEASDKVSPESFALQMDTVLRGTFFVTAAVLPSMVAQGKGVVINLGSIAGSIANPKLAVYSAAKAGVVSLTRSLALEYAGAGVRFVCLSPGIVDTPLMNKFLVKMIADKGPLKKAARAEEVAATIRFLMSEEAGQFLGHEIVAAGGLGL